GKDLSESEKSQSELSGFGKATEVTDFLWRAARCPRCRFFANPERGRHVMAASKNSKKAKSKEAEKTEGKGKALKLSALEDAAKVLGETGKPMSCNEMIEAMAGKGYWSSPGGKTPASTLYSAILKEVTTKGKESRFKKTGRGRFARA